MDEGGKTRGPLGAARALIVFAVAFVVLFAGAGSLPLLEPDEGRYAEIASGFLGSDDWVTPRLDGIAYYEKPPLFFWLCAASLRVFGRSELAARLPSILAAAATATVVACWGARAFGRRAGLLAAAVLVGSPFLQVFGPVAMVDPLLTLAITVALFAAWRTLVSAEEPRARTRAVATFWVALGLGALVKGPVALVLPMGSVAAFLVLARDRAGAWRLAHPLGVLAFVAIAAPWFVLMALRHEDYAREFFLSQNLARFTTGGRFHRVRAIWFYVPVLLGFFVPWIAFAPEVVRGVRERLSSFAASRRFLACSVVVPLVVLSLARNKLVYYVLPLAPPLALLVAEVLVSADQLAPGRRTGRRRLFALGALVGVLAVGALALPEGTFVALTRRARHSACDERELATVRALDELRPRMALAAGALAVAACGASLLCARGRAVHAAVLLAGTLATTGAAVRASVAPAHAALSPRDLAQLIARERRPGEPVVCFREFLRGLPFYLGERVILSVAKYDEFGHDPDPRDVGDGAIELATVSLAESLERLRATFDRAPTTLVVLDRPERVAEIAALTSHGCTVLGSRGSFTVARTFAQRPR